MAELPPRHQIFRQVKNHREAGKKKAPAENGKGF